jgi:non-ribosomal peptide synthetase component F
MAFENQEYPFEELVEKLSVKRDIGRNPLFDTLFAMQNENYVQASQEDSQEKYRNEDISPVAKFDLTLTAEERKEEREERGQAISFIFFSFSYCTKLFKKETVERFIEYFKKIVSVVVDDPGIKLCKIEVLSREEKKRISIDFNETRSEYPVDKTIHGLFEEQVEKTPDAIALVGRSLASGHNYPVQLSYSELNERANEFASILEENGTQPGSIIGIKIGRYLEMISGVLGILISGGTFLPIDPDYPQERIDYMLKDANVSVSVICVSEMPPAAHLFVKRLDQKNFSKENTKIK